MYCIILGRPKAGQDLKIPIHGGCSMLHEFLQKVAQNDKNYGRDEKAPKFTVGSKK